MAHSGGRSGGTGPDDGPAQADGLPSIDALLGVLADARRRSLLEFLREGTGEARSFEAATEHVVGQVRRERGEPVDREAVELELHHRHLPRLAAVGVVEYDTRSGAIRYRSAERLEALLDCVRELQQE